MESNRVVNLNYTFRNRLEYLKKYIIDKNELDAIILILCILKLKIAHDSRNNIYITKLFNWLVFGCTSSIEVEEKVISLNQSETFMIIEMNSLFVFSNSQNRNFYYELFSKVCTNVEYYFLTKEEEQNSEDMQIVKIAKFIEKTKLLKKIGIPLMIKEKANIIDVEKWPLINATGLDAFGEGFFTMKHQIIDISGQYYIF